MLKKPLLLIFIITLHISFGCAKKAYDVFSPHSGSAKLNTTAPSSTVNLIFIHHSCGANWLSAGDGTLGIEFNANNYYVSETYYFWTDPPSPPAHTTNMGSYTDTVDWPFWFTDDVMPYVYGELNFHPYHANTISKASGSNTIIMFKSCYPQSVVGTSIDDEKLIYNSLLSYFALHQDKMFVLIVPPPQITISDATNTRKLANWLVDGWLSSYTHKNVYVFDFYNILTDPNNHHRVVSGKFSHEITTTPTNPTNPNELYYFSGGDNHPTSTGNQKATAEFLPFLNACYHLWKGN